MGLKQNGSQIKIAVMDHNPDIGGAETSLLTLLRNIDRSRFVVTVILPSEGDFSRELRKINIDVDIIYFPSVLIGLKRGNTSRAFLFIMAYLFSIQFFLMKLCTNLKRSHFDLVLTNTVKAHLYGSIAARLCCLPLVWRFHDILSPTDFSPLLIKCITFFGNSFPTKVLAVSNTARDYLVKNGFKSPKVEVIFNGIDNEALEVRDATMDIREELKLQSGTKLVGCIGRIIPQKGQRSFLLAIPKVIDEYPDTFFLIIGDIFLKEEKYREELLNTIKDKAIVGRVKFTGFRTDIGDVIRSLDVVVFPSVAPESFGLSVLEAMYLEKPVIASNLGGVRELIEDGVTGMLVEPDHPEQIADRIIALFSNKELYDRIAKGAQEATRKFSLENYVVAMEKACREVVLKEVNH
jgi:glycosyltransferase involved in cell wall biosynthesis